MSKVVSAHQPNFLPYLGFFDKMKKSDVLVIRDEVLFVKKEFHNRNRIRINGANNLNDPQCKWLSVPVEDPKDFIKHVMIKRDLKFGNNESWNKKLLREIRTAYSKAKYFDKYYPELERIFDNSDSSLVELNMKVIGFLKKAFGIDTEIVMASDLELKGDSYSESDPSLDLALICEKLGADVYLSGKDGSKYLNLDEFDKRGIRVEFQDYKHPEYEQAFPGFLGYMGAIDALFCCDKIPELELEEEVVIAAR